MKKHKGFSLIELMVVISIIAVLVAVGTVAFTTAQKKSRDAKRRSDMRAVQNAFEQYYTQNGGYENPCSGMATSNYLPGGLPQDPKPSWPTNPNPGTGWTNGYRFSCDATADTYCACVLLENETGNATSGACAYGSGNYYCVSNQQ